MTNVDQIDQARLIGEAITPKGAQENLPISDGHSPIIEAMQKSAREGDSLRQLAEMAALPLDQSAMEARLRIVGRPKKDGTFDALEINGKNIGNEIRTTHTVFCEWLDQGYDKIQGDEQKATIRGWVEAQIRANPVTSPILDSISDSDKKEKYIEALCRDPRLLHHIRTKVSEHIHRSKKEFDGRISELVSKSSLIKKEKLELQKLYHQSDQEDLAYLDGFSRSVRDGVQGWIEEQVNEKVTLMNEVLEKKKQEAQKAEEEAQKRTKEDKEKQKEMETEKFKRQLYEQLQKRHTVKDKNWLGKDRMNFQKENINKDYEVLLHQGDEQLFYETTRSFVSHSSNTPELVYEELKQKGFTNEEIQAMRTEVAAQVLQYKIASGGIRERDVHMIAATPWGEKVINSALAKNQIARDMIEKLAEKGGIIKTGWERVKQILKNNPWLFFVLFGVGAVAFAGIKAGLEDI